MPQVYIDERWVGEHGIGRVASVLLSRLESTPLGLGGSPTSALDPLRLWRRMRQLPRDCLVLSPGYNAPLFAARRYIFIVHDLNHIDRPENSSFLKRLYYALIVKRACRFAMKVLTVSEFSKERIRAWSGISAHRIQNVGNGVDAAYCPDGPQHAPGYPYLLCVSNRKLHKNEPRILEAFAQAGLDPAIKLVLTGAADAALQARAHALGIGDRVCFLGRVPEADMPDLYRGALALVFPSLYEGFGLPVVEAMACGTPVLTSTTSSLPEVAADAGLCVDPDSVPAIARGIKQIVEDHPLRDSLRARGLVRAQQFHWDSVVRRTSMAISDALVGKSF